MSVNRTLLATLVFSVGVIVAAGLVGVSGVVGAASAPPADNSTHTLSQPNGVEFEATQWGNEFNHGWETTAGYTITQGSDDWWWYATVENGQIVSTDKKAGIDAPPADISKHVRGQAQASPKLAASLSGDNTTTLTEATATTAKPMPSTGDVNIPVILINYTDTKPKYTTGDFQDLVFGDNPDIASGPGSMKDYYEEASYGKLHLSGGSNGVTDWQTADHSREYYGGSEIDTQTASLAREAVRKADDDLDYSEYDNNNDGVVDGVIVIHQGEGEEASGDSDDIWSHRWSFTGAGLDPYRTDDGMLVNSYSLQPELLGAGWGESDITTVGVLAHETGHLLGMPDLYDYDGSSAGIGKWGLMAGGSWNRVDRAGDSPAHPTAFLKWQQGWIDPAKQPLTGPMGSLDSYTETPSTFQWRDNPNGPEVGGTGEYFLATNRQRTGFDRGIPGSGMLITHIDETRTHNDNENHKLVDVEAADGENELDAYLNNGDPGDVFPGETNANGFNSTTNPSSQLYDGSSSGLAINDIDTDGNVIEVNLEQSVTTPPSLDFGNTPITTTTTESLTVTNDGYQAITIENVSLAGTDTAAFTVQDSGQQVVEPGASTDITVTFTPTERRNYTATAVVDHNASETPAEVSLTGAGGTANDTSVTITELTSSGDTGRGYSATLNASFEAPTTDVVNATATWTVNGDVVAQTPLSVSDATTKSISVPTTALSTGTHSAAVTITNNTASTSFDVVVPTTQRLSAAPDPAAVAVNNTTTVDLTFGPVYNGIGSVQDFTVSVNDSATATIQDVNTSGVDGLSVTSHSNSRVVLAGESLNSQQYGWLQIATITLSGEAPGTAQVSLEPGQISNSSGTTYGTDAWSTDSQLTTKNTTITVTSGKSPIEVVASYDGEPSDISLQDLSAAAGAFQRGATLEANGQSIEVDSILLAKAAGIFQRGGNMES